MDASRLRAPVPPEAPAQPAPLDATEDEDSLVIEPPLLPEPPTPPEPMPPEPSAPPTLELPSLDLDALPEPPSPPMAPIPPLPPPAGRPAAAPPKPKVDPLAALAALKSEAKKAAAPVKAKPLDHKEAINSLLGELTLVGRSGAPSVLRLELPSDLEGPLEVVVQLRAAGEVVAEGQLQRPVPAKGATSKLTVEIKRA
jgi:hypothetical protein